MTKSKIKTIIMVVAVLLVLVLAGGWIAQSVVQKDNQTVTVADAEGCFIVTPNNTENAIMTLSAEIYSADSESSTNFYTGEIYLLTANIESVKGHNDVEWSVEFIDTTTAYAMDNDVSNYIELITDESDSHKVLVKCLQPFREQLIVKASVKNNSSCYVTCVCDYEQRYVYNLIIDGYVFKSDGSIIYSDLSKMSVLKEIFTANFSTTVSNSYSVTMDNTLYTLQSDKYYAPITDMRFYFEPTAESIAKYEGISLPVIECSGEKNGVIPHFFDNVWAQADDGDYTFVKAIYSAPPSYQLRMSGTYFGEVIFPIYLDISWPNDYIALDTDNIQF